jgi:hypothetical protein
MKVAIPLLLSRHNIDTRRVASGPQLARALALNGNWEIMRVTLAKADGASVLIFRFPSNARGEVAGDAYISPAYCSPEVGSGPRADLIHNPRRRSITCGLDLRTWLRDGSTR